jgi:Protein of unknown function (DUF2817)
VNRAFGVIKHSWQPINSRLHRIANAQIQRPGSVESRLVSYCAKIHGADKHHNITHHTTVPPVSTMNSSDRVFAVVTTSIAAAFVAVTLLSLKRFSLYNKSCHLDSPVTIDGRNIDTCHVFSLTYPEARQRFVEAAQQIKQAKLSSLLVQQDEAEKYTIDVALIPGTAPGYMIHSSGCHGVEGYTGSAIQIAVLDWLADTIDDNVHRPSILLIHAINPYGMDNYRRANENNVDLNRNALSPQEWNTVLSETALNTSRSSYDRFDALFNPKKPPNIAIAYVKHWFRAASYIAKYGMPQLKAAMVRGQYHNANGLMYGGGQHVVSDSRTDNRPRRPHCVA